MAENILPSSYEEWRHCITVKREDGSDQDMGISVPRAAAEESSVRARSGVNRGARGCQLETSAKSNAAILRDASAVRRMAPFEVGLFKGNAYPGQEGRGLVYRSPHAGPARRLKLSVDSTEPIV